jgi:zinc transport system ATP-binding protein
VSDTHVLVVDNVSFSYEGPPVLENVTLTVDEGEMLGLVGPNGGGKSTLLKIILGLLRPDRGKVSVLGRSPADGRKEVGYVPQSTRFPRDFPISVEEAVLMGRLGQTRFLGGYRRQDREVATEVMEATEVCILRERRLGELSGGQLQRVLIARALASRPKVLILDEPTAHMDLRVEEDVFGLLKKLNSRMTIVVVSHDVGFISHYVTRAACLNRSLLCHQTVEISQQTMDKLYGAPVRMVHHDH